jgi:hypothetical protein
MEAVFLPLGLVTHLERTGRGFLGQVAGVAKINGSIKAITACSTESFIACAFARTMLPLC